MSGLSRSAPRSFPAGRIYSINRYFLDDIGPVFVQPNLSHLFVCSVWISCLKFPILSAGCPGFFLVISGWITSKRTNWTSFPIVSIRCGYRLWLHWPPPPRLHLPPRPSWQICSLCNLLSLALPLVASGHILFFPICFCGHAHILPSLYNACNSLSTTPSLAALAGS